MKWFDIIISILTGLATAIPLAVQLVKYVKQAMQEKNWQQLVDLVLKLIQEAEEKFESGAEKRAWVLGMVKASADAINYPIDLEQVGKLVDQMCGMSKMVNVTRK